MPRLVQREDNMFRPNLAKAKRPFFYLVALLLLSVPAVQATTWDVTADFSISANPNGAWSYGYEPLGGGTFTKFTETSDSASGKKWFIANTGLPAVWKNLSGSTIDGLPTGELSLHPSSAGSGTALAVARWTAPTAGTFSVSGSFGTGDTGWMSYYIFYDNDFSHPVVSHLDDPNTETFSFTRTVVLGNIIEFVVGPGSGGPSSGNTPLKATINSVPLPGAAWLLGFGLLRLVGCRRVRKS